MNEVAANPFSSSLPAQQRQGGNAVAQSDQQRAVAEVQAAMMIARMNPRDPIVAMDRILNACARPTLADSAVYTYSRGGSDVSGPSIRLAEAMAQAWGNMQFGIRELDQRNGESTVQAFAWDVETNTRREVTFQVPHIRYTRSGSKRLEDPRDIYEMVANQGSRRLRACILAVIPGDVTEAAVAQCETTMRTKADTSPEAVQKMLAAFEPFGVSKDQIEKRIQRRLDAIQPAQVVSLKKIYASLRDGMSAPSDWFEAEGEESATPTGSRTEDVKNKIRGKKPAADTPPPPEPEPKGDEQDDALRGLEQTGQAPQQEGVPEVSYAKLAEKMQRAKDLDELAAAADLIQFVPDISQRDELGGIYKQKAAEFKAK